MHHLMEDQRLEQLDRIPHMTLSYVTLGKRRNYE